MTPTINPLHSNNMSSEKSSGTMFDINRFNHTPQARHYKRVAQKNVPTAAHDKKVSGYVSDARRAAESQKFAFPEYKTQSPEEVKALLDRIKQTAEVLEWMRGEEMAGR